MKKKYFVNEFQYINNISYCLQTKSIQNEKENK